MVLLLTGTAILLAGITSRDFPYNLPFVLLAMVYIAYHVGVNRPRYLHWRHRP